ncbi:sialidase family protein [Acidobacteriota bacterium]
MIRTATLFVLFTFLPYSFLLSCSLDCPSEIKQLNTGMYGGWWNDHLCSRAPVCHDDRGHIYVAFFERNMNNSDIFVTTSSDYGFSWSSAIRVDTGDAPWATDTDDEPVIACDNNGHVYVVWTDWRVPGGAFFINTSADWGQSFEPAARQINVHAAVEDREPFLACDEDGHVYVFWPDSRNGEDDVFFKATYDYGQTWTPTETRLDVYDAPGSNRTDTSFMTIDDSGGICVLWLEGYDDQVGNDIFFSRSDDHGQGWSLPVRLSTEKPENSNDSSPPRMVVLGDAIYVLWRDSLDYGIYYTVSLDRGMTWFPEAQFLEFGVSPAIAATNDGRVHVSWVDLALTKIYTSVSTDYANPSSWSTPTVVSSGTPAGTVSDTRIAVDDEESVYVLYRNRFTSSECRSLFLNRSCDRGISWPDAPVDIDRGCGSIPYKSINQILWAQGNGNVFTAWMRYDPDTLQDIALFRRIPGIQSVIVDPGPFYICEGDTITLDATQSTTDICPGNLDFQWIKEGMDIPAATLDTSIPKRRHQ